MAEPDTASLQFCDADAAMRRTLLAKLNVPGRHSLREEWITLPDDGFTIVALKGGAMVGVIAIHWKMLPAPYSETKEAYINLIDVDPEFQRQGIAAKLIELAMERASKAGAYQMRAWTSDEPQRAAALSMWRALGFAICPTEILAGPRSVRVRGCFVAIRIPPAM